MAVVAAKLHLMPCIELEGEKDIQLKVQVGSLAIDSRSRVAHSSEHVSGGNPLTLLNYGGSKMGIETQEWAVAPVMFDDYVFPVIASSRTFLNIDNAPKSDGPDVVNWSSARVSLHRSNIDSLVESRGDYPLFCPPEIAYKAVTSTLPWLARLALKGAIYIHVELFRVILQKRPVVGW